MVPANSKPPATSSQATPGSGTMPVTVRRNAPPWKSKLPAAAPLRLKSLALNP